MCHWGVYGGGADAVNANTLGFAQLYRGGFSQSHDCVLGSDVAADLNSTYRLAPQDGQKPRPLQEKATRCSCRQPSHFTRKKPCSRRPQRKYLRNSSTTKAGNDAWFSVSSPVSVDRCCSTIG